VLAAPAVREIYEPRDDVIVRVLARDVKGVSEKPDNTLGGKLDCENSDDEGYHTALDEDDESTRFSTTPPPSESPPKPAPSKKTSTRAEDNDPR
jgi:hypothetical protein